MKLLFVFLILFVSTGWAQIYDLEVFKKNKIEDNILAPFESDACSVIAEGTKENPTLWQNCCVDHDFKYWIGGVEEERKKADNEFYSCLIAKTNPVHATMLYLGVRMGGSPHSYSTYRWGFGWRYLRGYKPFTESDQRQIDELTSQIKNIYDHINKDTQENVEKLHFVTKNFCEEEILFHFANHSDFSKVRLRKLKNPYGLSYQVKPLDRRCYFEVELSQRLDDAMCSRAENIYVLEKIISRLRQIGDC